MCHEQKEARNGVVSEGQGLGSYEEDESRIVERTINVNNGSFVAIEVHDVPELRQQQPQDSVICWETFLPLRSLKVLLVENDDSTRHIVSALLRNCSYEVMAVANGLQAWKVLEDLTYHIDIVLTEVAMPVLSGTGLLCKIMDHKTFKNIPVIMMSSHDSLSLVFKCFSRGAIDFLVKPIRKNELKNLWRHVWRRCHSSSSSGSESGIRSKKSIKSKSNYESGNYAASSNEHDNWSDGMIICDESENGSGTQNSWTKRAAEAESSQQMSSSNQLPDSTCIQVFHARPEKCRSLWACVTETKECQKEHEQDDDAAEGKDLEARVESNPECQKEHEQDDDAAEGKDLEARVESNPEFQCGHQHENLHTPQESINLKGLPGAECGTSDVPHVKDGASHRSGEITSLELTLKRLQGAADSRNAENDERNALRHSDSSAFSKYTTSTSNQALTGKAGSCCPLDNCSVTMKTERVHTFQSHSNGILFNQPSLGSSNENHMTTISKCIIPMPEAWNDKCGSISAFKCFHSSSFQPMQNGHVCSSQEVLTEMVNDIGFKTAHSQSGSSNQVIHVQHQCHLYEVEKGQHLLQSDHESSVKMVAITAKQCRSSNVSEVPSECNIINYSGSGSASGSNYGSNGHNWSSSGLNAKHVTMESDNGAAGATSGRSSGCGTDEDRVSQRVAALTKFRQKRKERCFEKRVRYQTRQRLAEQRPRIKGQFVRRIVSDSGGGKDCSSNGLTSEDNSYSSVR